eukprot:TRINITY_DN51377_c0_g1_i1.p1 TRINITY_DN51377_c0_g1~~TRINITY_DN51377_c0_g1_i1.p1  ORF type:complete len:300 (+),score=46.97 TRINITY_DN51377_c0_g1_i1:88-987(+)
MTPTMQTAPLDLEEILEHLYRDVRSSGWSFDEEDAFMCLQRALQMPLQRALAHADLQRYGLRAAHWCAARRDLQAFHDIKTNLKALVDHLQLDAEQEGRLLFAVLEGRPVPQGPRLLYSSPDTGNEDFTVTVLSVTGEELWKSDAVPPDTLVVDVKSQVLQSIGRESCQLSVTFIVGGACLSDSQCIGSCAESEVEVTAIFTRDFWQGTVAKFCGAFGFIRSPEVGEERDVFVHLRDCRGYRPRKGDEVSFNLTFDSKRGFPKATNVNRLNRPSGVLQNQETPLRSLRLSADDMYLQPD